MAEFSQLHDAILTGNLNNAVAATKEAIAAGAEPAELVNNYMIKAMEDIGAKFEAGQAYVPNLLMAARAMKGSLELLKPMMQGSGVTSMGKIVIATVKGDLHDIGKNLVASMLEGCGFEVINLGVDQSDQKIVDAVNQHHPDILTFPQILIRYPPPSKLPRLQGLFRHLEVYPDICCPAHFRSLRCLYQLPGFGYSPAGICSLKLLLR